MTKYQKAVDVWSLNSDQRKALQPGQWVYAGNPEDKGIWCGQRSSGSDVVAWIENVKRRGDDYIRTLLDYAKG